MMSKSIRAPIGQECHSTTSFKCQLRLHSYILDRIRVYNIKLKNVIQYSHSMKYMSVEIHPDLCGSMHAYHRSRSTDLLRPLLPWCCDQVDFSFIYIHCGISLTGHSALYYWCWLGLVSKLHLILKKDILPTSRIPHTKRHESASMWASSTIYLCCWKYIHKPMLFMEAY